MNKLELGHSSGLSIAVLAGGKSSRMGADKGLLPLCGAPMVSHIIDNLARISDSIFIITNHPEEYKFLGVSLFADVIPGKNALGGLYSALCCAKTDFVAVIACDMIFANPAILLEGLKRLKTTGSDVAIPKSSQQYFEPLHAVYRTNTCRPVVLDAINQDQKRLVGWFPFVKVEEIDETICQRLDPGGMAFFNINTPEDKAIAERFFAEKQKSLSILLAGSAQDSPVT